MLAWLGLQLVVFETPEGEGIVVGGSSQAVVWLPGALPRVGERVFDPAEQALVFVGEDVSVCLIGGGEWTGRAYWAHDPAPPWQDASCPLPPSSVLVLDWPSWDWGGWARR